ncbi:uncharacterized protein LOC111400365 [Olea europaea var. sylvestris]|uniref:uncharacterized protein LOC111400365 n=1 Tax=Olea europaea var. sylvestris TaxID=158386 RepID=UPI000C1CD19A|nr:uncharacterized protein LOC111400365 [Olea europaea var. sylvestris]
MVDFSSNGSLSTKTIDETLKLFETVATTSAMLEEAPKLLLSYAKFLKGIPSNKRKLEEYETMKLTGECIARIQRKLLPKLKDLRSSTIPCTIGDCYFDKALCDLGASFNLMPLYIFRKLELGEAKATTITLQLANRSLTHLIAIIEDVLIKVEKFISPTNFLILDMEEDQDVPLI